MVESMTHSVVEIDDPADPRLTIFRSNERALASRADRREDGGAGRFMAEGDLVVARALDAGCTPVAALIDGSRPPVLTARLLPTIDVFAGGERLRTTVTGLGVAYGVVAIFERPPRATVDGLIADTTHLVLAEAVDNPANVGSMIRNAAALGWHGMVLDHTSADPLARRSLRASMGHAIGFPFARTPDIVAVARRFAAAGFDVVGLTPDPSATDIAEVRRSPRTLLAIGSERAGLSDALFEVCTVRVRIPMASGIDSLNAAAATAIACHALRPPS